jgi:selenocysteine lyase/cysteine desulfurase
MQRIYLDNAATSWPKAPGVGEAMKNYIECGVVNPNRTESALSFSLFETIYSLREMIGALYNYPHPECIAFTNNVTEALNLVIKGLFTKEDHVIISAGEHNAVMRTLVQTGVQYSMIPADRSGYNDYSTLESLLRENTRAVVVCHGSNVSGCVQNLEPVAAFTKKHNLMFFIDAAQTSPFVDIDMDAYNLTGVCFTCHKSFLGPEGLGGVILRRETSETLPPLVAGGTGSESDSILIPSTLPDRFDAGTENLPGLVGTACALGYTLENKEKLRDNAERMTKTLMEGIAAVPSLTIKGAGMNEPRTSVVSVVSGKHDIAYISSELLKRGNIETRVGLHCAPMAHRALGTFPTGTLRFSPGPFTTKDEIDTTLRILREIENED